MSTICRTLCPQLMHALRKLVHVLIRSTNLTLSAPLSLSLSLCLSLSLSLAFQVRLAGMRNLHFQADQFPKFSTFPARKLFAFPCLEIFQFSAYITGTAAAPPEPRPIPPHLADFIIGISSSRTKLPCITRLFFHFPCFPSFRNWCHWAE